MTETSLISLPLRDFPLPTHLDGSEGSNRAASKPTQTSASTDLEAMSSWLASVQDTPTTFANYRKEAERLYLWATIQQGKPLSSLTHEDLIAYKAFLANPQPAERWVSHKRQKFPRSDSRWRPFSGPLAPASQTQAMITINAMFAWLVDAGYLAGNPLSLLKRKTRSRKPSVTRYLDYGLWADLKNHIESLPRDTPRRRAQYARIRWAFTLFYLGGLRISEVTNGRMGDFSCDHAPDGTITWWLTVTGKGSKERKVPATAELMQELANYRLWLQLPAMPTSREQTPLILPLRQSDTPLTRWGLHCLIKGTFKRMAKAIDGADTKRAETIARASAHWLRHTAGTHMMDHGMDVRTVRDNFGHESISTTDGYVHTEDTRRHIETGQKHKINW
jgi:site-specific recombinase XerD